MVGVKKTLNALWGYQFYLSNISNPASFVQFYVEISWVFVQFCVEISCEVPTKIVPSEHFVQRRFVFLKSG